MSVAVVVPTYNGAKYLRATLDSIRAQRHLPDEIIVVDDGSVDDTPALARQFPADVRYIRTAENRGICHARNQGIAASTSRWIALCDHDDLWRPDKLSRQLDLLRTAPQVEFQFTDFVDVIDDVWMQKRKFLQVGDDYWSAGRRRLSDDIWLFETSIFSRLIRFQPVFPSTMLFSRGLAERIGGFDESLGREQTEDLEFTLRAVQRTRVAAIAAPLVGKRDHSGGYSGDNLATALSHIRVLRHVLQHHPDAAMYADVITEQIGHRSCDAATDAFARGDFLLTARLLRDVPASQLSLKLRIKAAIMRLPRWFAEPLSRMLVNLQGPRRS